MEKFVDRLLIRSGFMKKLIARAIEKRLVKSLGKNAQIYLGDTDATYEDGTLSIDISRVRIELSGDDMMSLVDKL